MYAPCAGWDWYSLGRYTVLDNMAKELEMWICMLCIQLDVPGDWGVIVCMMLAVLLLHILLHGEKVMVEDTVTAVSSTVIALFQSLLFPHCFPSAAAVFTYNPKAA